MICKGSHLREDCVEHGSCIGAALCSCNGVALCCMLAAWCPAHSALGCASRANLSGLFVFLLVGSAYGKMNLREAAGEPNLQWNCGLCTSRQSTSLGRYRRYSCWEVPKTWYAGESWRRPPLRTRGQGKPLEALAKGPKLRCGLALFSPCSSRSVVSG